MKVFYFLGYSRIQTIGIGVKIVDDIHKPILLYLLSSLYHGRRQRHPPRPHITIVSCKEEKTSRGELRVTKDTTMSDRPAGGTTSIKRDRQIPPCKGVTHNTLRKNPQQMGQNTLQVLIQYSIKYAPSISDKENRPLIRATVLINSRFSLNWTMMNDINQQWPIHCNRNDTQYNIIVDTKHTKVAN